MVATVIRAITPELVADTAAIHAASVAFLTNSIGCEGRAVDETLNMAESTNLQFH